MEPYQLSDLVTPFICLCIALMVRATLSFLETSITALRLFRLKELAQTTTQYLPLLQTLETIACFCSIVNAGRGSLGGFSFFLGVLQ
jgi:hypothetical protein